MPFTAAMSRAVAATAPEHENTTQGASAAAEAP